MEAYLTIGSDGEKISIEASVPVILKSKDGEYSAYCPLFNTIGFSNSGEEESINDLKRALTLFFRVHIKRGTLKNALSYYNWEKNNDSFSLPKSYSISSDLSDGKIIKMDITKIEYLEAA